MFATISLGCLAVRKRFEVVLREGKGIPLTARGILLLGAE